MRDELDIGCAPTDEPTAQIGTADYAERARRECRAFINQLRREFGPEPEGASLGIKSNPHDFGTYYSVVCYFESENREAIDYAYNLELQTPENWDQQARQELADGLSKRR